MEQKRHDFSKTLIRCSALGNLMTEPKTKVDKEAGLLSATAKNMLRQVYVEAKYDRRKEIFSKPIEKGLNAEEDSITNLSVHDKEVYKKNETRLNNDWFTGEPDLYLGESIQNADTIIDIKTPYDLASFISNVGAEINFDYYCQLQGYFSLSNAKRGFIAYVLTNTPLHIIKRELEYLFKKMNVATNEAEEYKKAAAEYVWNVTFDDIPLSERIIKIPVKRDDEFIESMKRKVEKAREYLTQFQELHLASGLLPDDF